MFLTPQSASWLVRIWVLIAICLPCICLFGVDDMFPNPAQDWVNQLWLFAYQANHLATTGWPADIFNYEHAAGLNVPLFYGTLLYPFGGLLSLLIGPSIALRVMIFSSFSLEYIMLLRLGRGMGWSLLLRHTVAICLVWAVYPLLNLYDRGALPEFFGFIFLVSSLACYFRFLKAPTDTSTRFDRYAWGFFYLLCCSTHPLTATMGGGILLVIASIGFLGLKPEERWLFISNGLIVTLSWIITESSWLWVMFSFGHNVVILEHASEIFAYFSKTLSKEQCFWTPIVPLTFAQPGILVSIYRGGRVATPLLLLLAGLISLNPRIKTKGWADRGFFIFGLIFAGLSYALITLSPFAVFMSPYVGFMQLGYRFNNFVNLGLLIALVGWSPSGLVIEPARTRFATLLMTGCILVAAVSLISKLYHVTIEKGSGDRWLTWQEADVHGLVPCFYGVRDYAIIENLPEVKESNDAKFLPFMTQPNDPDSATADITLTEATIVPTRVLPFPWNQVWANGVPVKPPELGVCSVGKKIVDQDSKGAWVNLSYYTVTLPPGKYRLEYRFSPPTAWLFLRKLSFFLAAIWGMVVIWQALREAWSIGASDMI